MRKTNLKISDARMFSWVFSHDLALCGRFLSAVLGKEIEPLEVAIAESTEMPIPSAKQGRLDVKAKGGNSLYDIEMQIADLPDLAYRARYYQGAMDVESLPMGGDYDDLPTSYVIFLCMKDFQKKGKPYWHYQMKDGEEALDDGRHVIFLAADEYGKMREGALRSLLHYVFNGHVSSKHPLPAAIDEAVRKANEDEEAIMYITREAEAAYRDKVLAQRLREIEAKDAEIEAKDAEIDAQAAEIAELRKMLAEAGLGL